MLGPSLPPNVRNRLLYLSPFPCAFLRRFQIVRGVHRREVGTRNLFLRRLYLFEVGLRRLCVVGGLRIGQVALRRRLAEYGLFMGCRCRGYCLLLSLVDVNRNAKFFDYSRVEPL